MTDVMVGLTEGGEARREFEMIFQESRRGSKPCRVGLLCTQVFTRGHSHESRVSMCLRVLQQIQLPGGHSSWQRDTWSVALSSREGGGWGVGGTCQNHSDKEPENSGQEGGQEVYLKGTHGSRSWSCLVKKSLEPGTR